MRLFGGREGEPLDVKVSIDYWEATVRPMMQKALLTVYLKGKQHVEAGEIEAGVKTWENLARGKDACWMWLKIGNIWRNGQKHDNAEFAYRRARESARTDHQKATVLYAIGSALKKLERWEQALVAYQEAMGLWRKLEGGDLGLAFVLHGMGNVALNRENLSEAERYYQQELNIKDHFAPNSLSLANSLSSLGSVAWKRGNLPVLEQTSDEAELKASLGWLMQLLERKHGRKVMLLIDEYDTPIQTSYSNGYYLSVVTFLQGLLGKALKGNTALEKALLTGILRVARESIFSDLKNVGVFSLLEHPFSDKFGFTESETEQLLQLAALASEMDAVRSWYNGYLMGKTVIYNPWSLLSFIASPEQGCRPYWVNISSNDLVREQLLHTSNETQEALQRLLRGETVETAVHEQTVFRDLSYDAQTLWSFLLFCGYLTVIDRTYKRNRQFYTLAIPNTEVMQLYQDIFMGWLIRRIGSDKVDALLKSLVEGHFETFGAVLAELVRATLSYYDTAGDTSERVYHVFVLGGLVHLGDRYFIRSNRESGFGRYDLLMVPRNKTDRGVILEFKVAEKPEGLDNALVEALDQIEKRHYGTELKSAGIKVRDEIAVAFCGKQVRVRGRRVTNQRD